MRPRIETRPVNGHFLSNGRNKRVRVERQHYFRTKKVEITDIGPLNCGLRSPEAQPDIFKPSPSAFPSALALGSFLLGVEENVRLLLEGTLRLDSQLGRHDCWKGGN